ncbi:MAG: hypothetical protein HQK83_16605 [Fibrobacteria bacterium]|nr:hypothetical protein [Fibrobacteria bacterium]
MKIGVAYIGVRDPDRIQHDLEFLVSRGYTYILLPYSEEDFLYYKETMREIIDITHACGLEIYVSPCGIGRVFDGEAFSELAGRNPSWAQVNNHDHSMVASCINNKDFHEYMRSWVEEVCSTEADSILWDNPHFYSDEGDENWCCRCEACHKLFRRKTNHLMPNSLTKSVTEFRISSIYEFLAEMTGLVHTKGKTNAVCFKLDNDESSINMCEEIAELPTVDELGVKPYWAQGEKLANISKHYREASKKLLMVCKKFEKEPLVMVKNFSIQKNNELSVAEATYAAYNEGIRNILSMAYKGSYSMSALRSDDADKVWQIQTEAFAECHDKAILNEMIDVMKSPKTE